MSIHPQKFAAAALIVSLGFLVAGCERNPFGERSHKEIDIAQVPAPVKAAIDQQAQGRKVGGVEQQTANGKTRYEVTLGTGSEKQTILLGADGKRIVANDDDDDED
ncbi:hypothetical protein [Cupriavidus basilensis]|jgi:hypothetical protein|uniref:hypothetical protein n=1 Tax=Cupriavidus basilensis TaxID=68895 RepID=UPI0020A6913D|nr:hypothetical protein [Cupriavidus basilensis]MCP3024047.1 hypothetical protein [Cupriavidus basilensis]